MSPEEWKDRLQDILDALVEIQDFTRDMDFGAFTADAKTVKAVGLNLIIIGEATNQIPDDVLNRYPQIPWPLMRAPRNPRGGGTRHPSSDRRWA